jgi:hypothetical protein
MGSAISSGASAGCAVPPPPGVDDVSSLLGAAQTAPAYGFHAHFHPKKKL